jgi:chemotaxis protein MotB
MRTVIVALVVALASVGCVGKSKYNALNKELQTCQQTAAATEQKLAATQAEQQALFQEKKQLEGKTKEYEEMVGSLQKEVDAGNVTISQMQDRLTVNLVDKVLFSSGSTNIQKQGEEALTKIAAVLKNYATKRVLVEGHTDNVPVGDALKSKYPTNWELSAARATKIARFLVDQGVDPVRMAALGFGEYRPIAPNDTPEGRRENRRIEISLLKLDLEKKPIESQGTTTPAK